MKKHITVLILSFFILPAFADKPEWAGKGKPTDAQKSHHKAQMTSKGDKDESPYFDEKPSKEKKKAKDKLEKHQNKKYDKEQKELDKGSEKGQESREQRKKWWKFWGE